MAEIIRIDYDWLYGRLRYGHREGVLNFCDEEYEEFKKDPEAFLRETGAAYELDFILEDYGYGEILYEEVEEEENG